MSENTKRADAAQPAKGETFDMSDREWLDVFERVEKTVPNVFGGYMRVRAEFAREVIRIADEARRAMLTAAAAAPQPVSAPSTASAAPAVVQPNEAIGYVRSADIDKWKRHLVHLHVMRRNVYELPSEYDTPVYFTPPAVVQEAYRCSRCGSTTTLGCTGMGCGYLESGDGEPSVAQEAGLTAMQVYAIETAIDCLVRDCGEVGSPTVLRELRALLSSKTRAYPPCQGMNCGCTNGINHSAECFAEHAATIAGGRFIKGFNNHTEQEAGLTDEQILQLIDKWHFHADEPVKEKLLNFANALLAHNTGAQPQGVTEAARERICDAVRETLGNAYDCTRVWSAWGVGTMGPDDFALVAEDDERVAEIADAAIAEIERIDRAAKGGSDAA